MKELKFRAWDARNKEMFTPKEIVFNEHYGVLFFNRFSQHNNDMVLMQFTGLKDINGKDIYDGDIVKESAPRGYKDIIVFEDGKYQMIRLMTSLTRESIKKYEFEIIGNLYENPELLSE